MRWLARVFASAIARRIAFIVVAAVLAWCGISESKAQTPQRCAYPAGQWEQCDQGEAFAECSAGLARARAKIAGTSGGAIGDACTHQQASTVNRYRCSYKTYAAGTLGPCPEHSSIASGYQPKSTCEARGSQVTPFFPPSGSVRCSGGCETVFRDNGDDTTTFSPTGKTCDRKPDCDAQGKNMVWNAHLGVCQPVEPECPEGKVKVGNACADEKPCPDGMALVNGSCKKEDNECPAGMIRSPLGNCIPGDNQCAEGETRGPDGTCKRDHDNDGEPDAPGDGDAESFSGGDTCDQPPSCSGSPIMCGQARIQWRIECNTRRNVNISGGACTQAGMPICTGDKCNAMEYTQLLMQWRSACAIEKLAAKNNDGPTGNSADKNGNGVADVLEGDGTPNEAGDGNSDVEGAKKFGIGVSPGMLDTSNMFGGGACPQPPSITIMGKTVSGNDMPYFCQLAAVLRALILIFGAYTALRILMGGIG